ncbi:MAG: hypothetical protein RL664_1187 [Bacteroidota bacterium]|jgi:hypothetical protein
MFHKIPGERCEQGSFGKVFHKVLRKKINVNNSVEAR